MSAEFREFTPSELGFQRMLVREQKAHSLPGEGLKRAGLNLSILLGSTAADLAESHVIDKVMRVPLENRIEKKTEEAAKFEDITKEAFLASRTDLQGKDDKDIEKAMHDAIHKKWDEARSMQGKSFAADFVEEWVTDGAYTSVANAWARMATGMPEAKYVSETAAFLSEWGNVISQVSLADKLWGKTKIDDVTKKIKPERGVLGIKLAYKSMDFINPVNVEAGIRLLEEIPIVGNGVAWLHEKSDKMLETVWARWGNSALGKAVLGYHIGRNVKPLELKHSHPQVTIDPPAVVEPTAR